MSKLIDLDFVSEDEQRIVMEAVLKLLEQLLGDNEIYNEFRPVAPAIIKLAIDEGLDEAEKVLKGLVGEDPYPYWERIMRLATPEQRIEIMEQARQAAVQEKIARLERDKKLWSVLKTVIGIGASLLLALI